MVSWASQLADSPRGLRISCTVFRARRTEFSAERTGIRAHRIDIHASLTEFRAFHTECWLEEAGIRKKLVYNTSVPRGAVQINLQEVDDETRVGLLELEGYGVAMDGVGRVDEWRGAAIGMVRRTTWQRLQCGVRHFG